MFPQQNKIRAALLRAQFECSRYLAAGSLPEALIVEVAEIAAILAMVEPGWVS